MTMLQDILSLLLSSLLMLRRLRKIFARAGIPKEILTDQGANFTSQLLAKGYGLLHVIASIPSTDRWASGEI